MEGIAGKRNRNKAGVRNEVACSVLPVSRSERQKYAPPRWDHKGTLSLACAVLSYGVPTEVPTKVPTNIPTDMPTKVPIETGHLPTFIDL